MVHIVNHIYHSVILCNKLYIHEENQFSNNKHQNNGAWMRPWTDRLIATRKRRWLRVWKIVSLQLTTNNHPYWPNKCYASFL